MNDTGWKCASCGEDCTVTKIAEIETTEFWGCPERTPYYYLLSDCCGVEAYIDRETSRDESD